MNRPPSRMTAAHDREVVVFLIGMRINSWWRVHEWMPVAGAMRRMLKELDARPELGLLGHERWFTSGVALSVQYWRSLDQLLAYAHARDSAHLPAWREFNRKLTTARGLGVWHETYAVPAGSHETIYFNMPAFGLGRATGVVEASGRRASARGRLGRPDAAPHSAASGAA
jgi:hypothetical protein